MTHRNCLRAVLGLLVAGLVAMPGLARAAGEKEEKGQSEVKRLQKQLAELQDEVKTLRERVQVLEKNKVPFPFPAGGFPPAGAFQPPGGGFPGFGRAIKGTVKKFDKEKGMVTFTVAADSGIKAGQSYMAMKAGTPPRMIGMVKVKEVSDKEVTGQINNGLFPAGPGASFEADQEVTLMPGPTAPFTPPGGPKGFPGGFRPPNPPPGPGQ